MSEVTVRDAGEADLAAIRDIYNHAVETSTAVWTDDPVDLEERRRWLVARRAQGCPVLVAERDGEVAGYASFGGWRAFEGYRATVEHSVYVRADQRGTGVGRALLEALIGRARGLGKHVMVGAVEAGNAASLALHLALGFRESGRLGEVGAKFGRWLDLVLVELKLDDRPSP